MLDTEEKLLTVASNYFSTKDITVVPVNTLEKAFLELEGISPDCIILDIAMCNQIGYKFVHEIKKDKKLQHIPLVFLTAKGLTEDRIKGYNLGCSSYVSKPFDPEELKSIIEMIISEKKIFLDHIKKSHSITKEIRINLIKNYKNNVGSTFIFDLTSREQLILKQILSGNQPQEIAYQLNVSKRTIEKYITRLLDKTQTKNTMELKSLPWETFL